MTVWVKKKSKRDFFTGHPVYTYIGMVKILHVHENFHVHEFFFWRSIRFPKWDFLLKIVKNPSTDDFSSILISYISFSANY